MFACVTSGLITPGVRTGSARTIGPLDRFRNPKATASSTTAARTRIPRTLRGCSCRTDRARRVFRLGRSVGQCVDLAPLGEASEGLRLDLSDAFPRQAEDPADLLQRPRIGIAVHPVAQLHDLPFAVGERLDRKTYRFLAETDVNLLRRLG